MQIVDWMQAVLVLVLWLVLSGVFLLLVQARPPRNQKLTGWQWKRRKRRQVAEKARGLGVVLMR